MSLRETLESIRNQPTPPNEETAKFQIIAPVLKGLGWDPFSTDVSYEHRVETAKGTGRVDIALRGETHTVAHIEAKAPGQDLNRHAKQAVGYAFDEGVDICALTTGLEWQLYLPRANRPHKERLFVTLRLQQDRIDQLAEDLETFLSKENLLNGRAERRATEVLEARRQADLLKTKLPEIWSRMVHEPDERLVELVVGQAYEKLNLRPAPEQVKAVLRGSPVPAVALPEPDEPAVLSRRPGPRVPEPQPERRSHGQSAKIVAYTLWGQRYPVKTWVEMVVGVAEALHHRHGNRFVRILDLRTRRRGYWASLDPDSLSGSSQVIANTGIYVATKFNRSDAIGRAQLFLEYFGHDPDDLTWEESGDFTPLPRMTSDPAVPAHVVRDDSPTKRRSPKRRLKIVAYELWGERHAVKTWKSMLIGVAESLYRLHGPDFDRILAPTTRRGRPYASRNENDVREPRAVGNSGIYIHTNLSADEIKRRASGLLDLFGHSPDDLRIEEG